MKKNAWGEGGRKKGALGLNKVNKGVILESHRSPEAR